MDVLAAVGSLVISEGAMAPLVITTGNTPVEEPQPPPVVTPQDRQATDAVFTTHDQKNPYSVPATLLVVSASVATLKSIAIDEQKSANEQEEEEETPPPGQPRREKDAK
jgi:hypothetical protein